MSDTSDTTDTSTAEAQQQKAENEKKTAELRERLLQQQKAKVQKANIAKGDKPLMTRPLNGAENEQNRVNLPPDDLFSPGRLRANAKATALAMIQSPKKNIQAKDAQRPRVDHAVPPPPKTTSQQTGMPPPPPRFRESLAKLKEQVNTLEATRPTSFNLAHYPDLELWLEVTGYHNVDHRNAVLGPHKERKELEKQAAEINERLKKLQQGGSATVAQGIRQPPTSPAINPFTQPPKPHQQPQLPRTNPVSPAIGRKRPRSPAPSQGFRPRHDTLDHRSIRRPVDSSREPVRGRRMRSPPQPSGPLERRITYPDRRGRSRSPDRRNVNMNYRADRDPSLERRQQYYGTPRGFEGQHDIYSPRYEDRTRPQMPGPRGRLR